MHDTQMLTSASQHIESSTEDPRPKMLAILGLGTVPLPHTWSAQVARGTQHSETVHVDPAQAPSARETDRSAGALFKCVAAGQTSKESQRAYSRKCRGRSFFNRQPTCSIWVGRSLVGEQTVSCISDSSAIGWSLAPWVHSIRWSNMWSHRSVQGAAAWEPACHQQHILLYRCKWPANVCETGKL